MMTLKEKLDSYVRTYQKGAYLINYGSAKWIVAGHRKQKADIARKAIMLGMKIKFIEAEDCYKSMVVYY